MKYVSLLILLNLSFLSYIKSNNDTIHYQIEIKTDSLNPNFNIKGVMQFYNTSDTLSFYLGSRAVILDNKFLKNGIGDFNTIVNEKDFKNYSFNVADRIITYNNLLLK